jgi:hypothetical protein
MIQIASGHRGELVLQYYRNDFQLGYLTRSGEVIYQENGRWWLGVDGKHLQVRKVAYDISLPTCVACDIPLNEHASRGFGLGASVVVPKEVKDKLPILQQALKEYLNSPQQTNSTDTRGVRYGTESKNQVDQHGPEQAR